MSQPHRHIFRELYLSQPFKDVWSSKVQGCAYGDYVFNSKNCYLSFELGGSQDCGYLDNCMKCIDCFDCSGCKFSQLCSDGLYLEKSYNCHHSQHLSNCSDCFYSAELFNCQHCFGCYALKHKQYYIFNQPRTKQEYATELPGLLSDPAAAAVRCSELRRTIGVVATHIRQSQDCSGDYIFNSHNCYHCFDINNNHDSAYLYDCLFHSGLSDCFDIDGAGGCELSSNCFSVGNSYNIHHCVLCSNLNDCSYCARCRNLKNCFGCVYLKDKQYYIFNQPYSAEDYHREVARLQGEFQRQGVSDMYSLVYGG